MKYSEADCAMEKRDRGLVRFLLMDGIIITGGPFAVVLQVVGYFFSRDEGQTFGQYFSASRTWMTIFFYATLFGLIMGYINWWRNERKFAKTKGEG